MINYKLNFLGLALSGLILGTCNQTGTYVMNGQAADKAGFKLTPFGTGNENAMILTGGGDYLTNCITDQSGITFKATGSLSDTWGG